MCIEDFKLFSTKYAAITMKTLSSVHQLGCKKAVKKVEAFTIQILDSIFEQAKLQRSVLYIGHYKLLGN